jgi:hypothetical protein
MFILMLSVVVGEPLNHVYFICCSWRAIFWNSAFEVQKNKSPFLHLRAVCLEMGKAAIPQSIPPLFYAKDLGIKNSEGSVM